MKDGAHPLATKPESGPTGLVQRQTLQRQVHDVLLADVTSGKFQVNQKLPSIHALARRYTISTTPIRKAILELENDGYLERRHGSGTYVLKTQPRLSMRRTVMLCMAARAHLYGTFNTLFSSRLFAKGLLTAVVDTEREEGRSHRLAQALASDAQCFVIHGETSLPFEQIAKNARPGRHFLGVFTWETRVPFHNLHRVLSDYRGGGRLVADHLWSRGHRHVLLIGTQTMIKAVDTPATLRHQHGCSFAQRWRMLGGALTTLASELAPADNITVDTAAFLDRLRQSPAPTAVFGLRDLELWHAQTLLLRHAPKLADSMELIGHGNTPWSQAGHPPFSTVDLGLEEIADHAMRIVEAILNDRKPPDPDPVRQHLVLR